MHEIGKDVTFRDVRRGDKWHIAVRRGVVHIGNISVRGPECARSLTRQVHPEVGEFVACSTARL